MHSFTFNHQCKQLKHALAGANIAPFMFVSKDLYELTTAVLDHSKRKHVSIFSLYIAIKALYTFVMSDFQREIVLYNKSHSEDAYITALTM